MKNRTKPILFALLALTLSGCATSIDKKEVPIQISVAPAIDVPYSDVVKNIPEHIGVKVRWGGQIIGAEQAGDITRLTMLAYPLNSAGQPDIRSQRDDFTGGRFIVETHNFDPENPNRFMTVYGAVTNTEVLTNGKLTKSIPVVTALESSDWDPKDQRYANERLRLPYNGLALGLHFGHRGYYGRSSFRGYNYGRYSYGRFGGRTGFNSFYSPYRYSGFRSRRYR